MREVAVVRAAGRTPGAPALLCVPGTMSDPVIFDGLAEATGTDVVVAPWLEWPGPHDMASLGAEVALLAERHAPVVLLGHSTGGVIALSAALRTDRVRGVVVCDSGVNMRGHGDVDAIIDRVREQWGPELWRAVARRSVHLPVPAEVAERLDSYPAGLARDAVLEALRSQRDTDLAPRLAELGRLPALVVHGRFDRARTLAHAEELAGSLPGSELVVLESGHTPPVELPDRFAAELVRFLARLPDGG
ncbi:alpha/beta hydrolase [Saccharopolyspora sp. NFXS83]|uniref:alpha/beta fold hydrolase n=1 Tax=Saccharopolyspora sp. NFXS83 TaxID=2993560 RepID=UPI00224A518B|nr:alpha/beta hydrolase [Saccharopolyspora sp. NFXS83]MCX2733981.1 alpha/beta hydrolase [Saccharopolyspora sp. NFXS83]